MPEPSTRTWNLRPDDALHSIYTAMREQLGLKLEAGRAPVEMIVIDRIERASEN
jgi:uncharacterized protein (TIGR03435 family)